jgi:DNA-directed RNA polymerase I subunit RPA2
MRSAIPQSTEIYCVCDFSLKIYPQIDISTDGGRFLRPVFNISAKCAKIAAMQQRIDGNLGVVEWISPLEQTLLDIAVARDEIEDESLIFDTSALAKLGAHAPMGAKACGALQCKVRYSHCEVSKLAILSVLASLTPFSDMNQSPRNMYQCQMLKQAMGAATHNFDGGRVDNKAYRLMTCQSPIVRNRVYDKYECDDFAAGTNAVVAVISYTGFDMEDAMIICKESMERGFKHGYVYTTEIIDLREYKMIGADGTMVRYMEFKNTVEDSAESSKRNVEHLNDYGMPFPGAKLTYGMAFACIWDSANRKFISRSHKKKEPCVVDSVRIIEDGECALIKLRFDRRPVIGDKFASRAGQKGTMSQLWPQRDMPFTESGIVPDLIINPHAFPSRMTIGMLLESMAAKLGALEGEHYDGSPFQDFYSDADADTEAGLESTERNVSGDMVDCSAAKRTGKKLSAIDWFGKRLLKKGMNYYGSETMYNGMNGVAMKADIFIGVVYYQRLRHMISDKYQARAMGPINSLTRQPIKGRKRGGGIRLCELERDAIVAHGCAFILNDRLFDCSDGELRWVCKACRTHLGCHWSPEKRRVFCRICGSDDETLTRIQLPHVFSYLCNELAAVNIRLQLECD